MDTGISYLSQRHSLDGRPPVMVAGASEQSRAAATRWIEEAGWRAAAFPIAGAVERLALQASASGLWIELGADDADDDLDRLLAHANHEAAAGRMTTIVAAPLALIDGLAARLDAGRTELLIDPDPIERTATLALALAAADAPIMLHDVAREPASQRLKQLSDEVGRIAATLARLSTTPDAGVNALERPVPATAIPPVSGETVRDVIRARRIRARYFEEELFADPAWDMRIN